MAKKFEHLQAPAALRELKGWLVWRWVQRPGRPKALKMPYYLSGSVRNRTHGSAEDRRLLVSFDDAKAFAEKHDFAGVGLALMPEFGITALDFDNCVKDGVIDPRVEKLTAGTYAELSPSGTGVRAFMLGESPDSKDSTPVDGSFGFETFHAKGFVTFTGHVTELTELTGSENTVAPLTEEVKAFCATRFKRLDRVRAECVGAGKPTMGFSFEEIAEFLKKLPEDLHYDDWVAVGMCVHHETEGEGFDIWDEWSSRSPKYTSTEYSMERWVSFGRNGTADYKTMGTVLQMIREHGGETGLEVASADEFESLAMPKSGKFRITADDEFAAQEASIKWLIKGFLPQGMLGVLFGESGAGKSFATLDMCAAISRGLETWNGHRVSAGRVLYVVAEGVSGFRQRIRAYCHQHALSRIGFDVIYDVTPNLMDVAQVSDLIKEVCEREPYDLIVMDTFAQVTAGANENSGEDVGVALSQCKRLAQRSGAMVLLVHHSGKDASKGSRGHSSIKAACDVELEVKRGKDTRSITTTKMKDGREGLSYIFTLHTVVLGIDEDGDDISSCIVEFLGPGTVETEDKKKKTGKNELSILGILHDLLGMETGGAIESARVRDEFVSQFEPGKKPGYMNQAFNRSIENLIEKGAIFAENGMISLSAENAD
jgi:archaellum biogenesis ATPase FlaH